MIWAIFILLAMIAFVILFIITMDEMEGRNYPEKLWIGDAFLFVLFSVLFLITFIMEI